MPGAECEAPAPPRAALERSSHRRRASECIRVEGAANLDRADITYRLLSYAESRRLRAAIRRLT